MTLMTTDGCGLTLIDADRSAAWKLLKADLVGEITLEEAREIVDRIGEMYPACG